MDFFSHNGLTVMLILLCIGTVLMPTMCGKFPVSSPGITGLFLCLLTLLVICGRWHITNSPLAADLDESQFIVSAWSAAEDPIFFRAIDCGSSGPFNIYPLLWSYLCGYAPSQFSARLLASVFMAGIACLAFVAARFYLKNRPLAMAAALPVALFFSLDKTTAYWQYNSEIPAMFYVMVGIAATAYILTSHKKDRVLAVACIGAVFLSLCPLAKLQSAPMALFVGIAMLCALLYRRCGKAVFAWTLLASGIVPILFLVLMAAAGEALYFWQAYFVSAISYRSLPIIIRSSILDAFLSDDVFMLFVLGTIAFAALAIGMALKKIRPTRRWAGVCAALLFCGLGFWTVFSPNKSAPHYLLYLPVPLSVLSIAALSICPMPASKRIWLFLCIALPAITVCFPDRREPSMPLKMTENDKNLLSIISAKAPNLDDRISIWGYRPDIYFAAARKSGTRMVTTAFFFLELPGHALYLDRYITDLRNNKPKLFIDVSPVQGKEPGLEYLRSFTDLPVLAKFIDSNYTYNGMCGGYAIYSLKEENLPAS